MKILKVKVLYSTWWGIALLTFIFYNFIFVVSFVEYSLQKVIPATIIGTLIICIAYSVINDESRLEAIMKWRLFPFLPLILGFVFFIESSLPGKDYSISGMMLGLVFAAIFAVFVFYLSLKDSSLPSEDF